MVLDEIDTYIRDTMVDSRGLGWAGQGSYGIYMRHQYFLNKRIQKKRDFGGQ